MNPNKLHISDLLSKVVAVSYILLHDQRTTICQVTVVNGFTLVGTSSVLDIANFDNKIGEKVSFDDAIRQLWALEGYLLAEKHYQAVMQTPIQEAKLD